MRRSAIREQNAYMLRRQHQFRMAADVVTGAFMKFDEVEAVALIGSVARPLWKEVPRFREFRRAGIEIWHECKDLDLAVWLSSLHGLNSLRRARDLALRDAYLAGTEVSTASHEVDIFLIEPGTDRYIGRLCSYNECPKGKPDCEVPGCGDIPFNKIHENFKVWDSLLAPASNTMLYRRGEGRLMSAVDLPTVGEDE